MGLKLLLIIALILSSCKAIPSDSNNHAKYKNYRQAKSL